MLKFYIKNLMVLAFMGLAPLYAMDDPNAPPPGPKKAVQQECYTCNFHTIVNSDKSFPDKIENFLTLYTSKSVDNETRALAFCKFLATGKLPVCSHQKGGKLGISSRQETSTKDVNAIKKALCVIALHNNSSKNFHHFIQNNLRMLWVDSPQIAQPQVKGLSALTLNAINMASDPYAVCCRYYTPFIITEGLPLINPSIFCELVKSGIGNNFLSIPEDAEIMNTHFDIGESINVLDSLKNQKEIFVPWEMWRHIAAMMDAQALSLMAQTSKDAYIYIKEKDLWKNLFSKHFADERYPFMFSTWHEQYKACQRHYRINQGQNR